MRIGLTRFPASGERSSPPSMRGRRGAKPTIREFLTSLSLPQTVVGSPETIAKRLTEYQQAGVDGVQVMNALMPESYEDFFTHLVPYCRRRA